MFIVMYLLLKLSFISTVRKIFDIHVTLIATWEVKDLRGAGRFHVTRFIHTDP